MHDRCRLRIPINTESSPEAPIGNGRGWAVKWVGLYALLLMMLVGACSSGFESSRYDTPSFRPERISVPLCPHADVNVSKTLDWIVIANPPQHVAGCGPSENGQFSIYGGGIGSSWRALDGGGGMAGTAYSMRSLLPAQREQEARDRKPSIGSKYFVPDEVGEMSSFVRNGLRWEQSVIREFTKYPEGGGTVPGDARVQRIRDVYIYKHPDGWWLRVQASFHPGMEGVPDLLASRRDTLRQVVNSVRIEPKDASRVSCTTDDKGRESCLYHRPQAQ